MLPLLTGDPREIGPYRVVGRLGAGGMGVVYAAVDASGRRVAVKLVHEALSTDLEFRRRFSREISVLGEVGGACVARVLGSDSGTERPWLAAEYVAGPTIEQHLRAEGPLTGDALYGLAAGLAEALVSMHALGVVHRDLKPSNVILSSEGPRLIDFGIAKVLDGSTMTHTGTLIGSPGWISPEEYGDGPSGTPADVYGWALLVLFAVTGEHPYGTGRPEVLAYRVRERMPETGAVPEGLRGLVERGLAKDPAERPAAAEILATVTDTWRGQVGEQEPETDLTSLIQRTWVLPREETSDWPDAPEDTKAARPVAGRDSAGTVPLAAGAAKTAGQVRAPVPGTAPGRAPASPFFHPMAGQPAPRTREMSWVHAYIATAAGVTLIAVIAIAAFVVTSVSERSTAVVVAQATPTQMAIQTAPTTEPATTPAPVASVKTEKRAKSKGRTVSFKGIRMTLPAGWRLLRVRPDLACVESPNTRGNSGPWNFACRPDAMAIKTGAGADSWPGDSIDNPYYGWAVGSPMPCLAGGIVTRDPNGGYDPVIGEFGLYDGVRGEDSQLLRSSLARMGDGRKAAYRHWLVPCQGNAEYTTKIWYLPQSKVALFVLSARPDDAKGYRQIISSTDLTGYRYAAPV